MWETFIRHLNVQTISYIVSNKSKSIFDSILPSGTIPDFCWTQYPVNNKLRWMILSSYLQTQLWFEYTSITSHFRFAIILFKKKITNFMRNEVIWSFKLGKLNKNGFLGTVHLQYRLHSPPAPSPSHWFLQYSIWHGFIRLKIKPHKAYETAHNIFETITHAVFVEL